MLDWAAVVDRLHHISKQEVARFLAGPDAENVYGIGFFCDASNGRVYLVANTGQYHTTSLRDFETRAGTTDPDVFKWDIGNWKYPGGLFPSSSAEQQAFDKAWRELGASLSHIANETKQAMLEVVCVEVLTRLIKEDSFAPAYHLEGVTVLGPDDRGARLVERKQNMDGLLKTKI